VAARNRFLAGLFAPVAEEITAFDLLVTGRIPPELNGRYLRNGPNPRGVVDPDSHWFIGAGMLHGVRLRDGRAEWYRNRWVRSKAVAESLGETWPAGPVHGGMDFAANTHVIAHGGRILATVEAGPLPTRSQRTCPSESPRGSTAIGSPTTSSGERRAGRGASRSSAVAGVRPRFIGHRRCFGVPRGACAAARLTGPAGVPAFRGGWCTATVHWAPRMARPRRLGRARPGRPPRTVLAGRAASVRPGATSAYFAPMALGSAGPSSAASSCRA
jgi:hypothetical protein